MDISSLENNAKELEKSVIIAKQNKKNIESEISSLKAKCTKLENDNLKIKCNYFETDKEISPEIVGNLKLKASNISLSDI